jgi:hypothetical protein
MRDDDINDEHHLDREEVMTLAAAIARGDMATAAMSLDVLFRDFDHASVIADWIAQARTSRAARPTRTT